MKRIVLTKNYWKPHPTWDFAIVPRSRGGFSIMVKTPLFELIVRL